MADFPCVLLRPGANVACAPLNGKPLAAAAPSRSGASWQHPSAPAARQQPSPPAAWPTQGRHAARARGRLRTLLRPVDRDRAPGDPPCSSGSPCPSVPSGGVRSPDLSYGRRVPARSGRRTPDAGDRNNATSAQPLRSGRATPSPAANRTNEFARPAARDHTGSCPVLRAP